MTQTGLDRTVFWRSSLELLSALVVSLLALSTPSVAFQDTPQEPTPQEGAEDEQPEEAKPSQLYWDDGLWFRSNRRDIRVKFGTQLQNDSAAFAIGDGQPVELNADVEWRRARFYALGAFARRWSFKLQWDFTTGRSPKLTDAWLALEFKLLKQQVLLRSGRFSSTFGLENDGSSNDILFMEQGLTAAFVPPQETGFLIHSVSNRRRWDFSFSNSAQRRRCLVCSVAGVAGRYSTSYELGEKKRRLHVGFNYSRRWTTSESVEFNERPESHIAPDFVGTGAILAERVDVALAEGAYIAGAFSLQSEYALTRVKASDTNPLFHAFYVSGSYALTGETRPYFDSLGTIRRVRPTHPLGSGGLGAFEIAFRLSGIDLNDQDVAGGELNDATFGLNWYPTYPTRVTFNLIRVDRRPWDPVWIFQARMQLAF